MKAYGKRLGKILVLAAVLNFLIEFISRKSLTVLLAYVLESPLVFLLNTCIIALPFTVLFFTKRRVFGAIVLSILWLGLGVVNGILLIFRTTPFTAADFRLIKYAANIATTYFTWISRAAWTTAARWICSAPCRRNCRFSTSWATTGKFAPDSWKILRLRRGNYPADFSTNATVSVEKLSTSENSTGFGCVLFLGTIY